MKIKSIAVMTLLVGLGSAQMLGDLIANPTLKGFGLATHVSPAPKVFTAQEGFETFSSQFFLRWQDTDATYHELELTQETYQGIKGPYNRRNVYGAAVSYSPVLSRNPKTKTMFNGVSQYAFCGDAPLLQELGINPKTVRYPLVLELKPRDTDSQAEQWQLSYQVNCNHGVSS